MSYTFFLTHFPKMRSISASSSDLDESLDELEDWLLLEEEYASGGARGLNISSKALSSQLGKARTSECPEVMTKLWKECITWATQSQQIHWTLACNGEAYLQSKKQWKIAIS